jgi:hypothetical protein
MIAEFRNRHGDTAFPCRYRFCARASNGFPTNKERDIHETSHRPRIKCPMTSCEFHVFGFGSKQALDRHNFQYHKDREPVGSQGSRLIRRKFDLALRVHFMEADLASTQPKRPRIGAVAQPLPQVTQNNDSPGSGLSPTTAVDRQSGPSYDYQTTPYGIYGESTSAVNRPNIPSFDESYSPYGTTRYGMYRVSTSAEDKPNSPSSYRPTYGVNTYGGHRESDGSPHDIYQGR